MVGMVVTVDGKSLKASLQWMGRQAPYATRLAQTRIAERVHAEAVAEMDRRFDRPTPYIKGGFWVKKATPGNPVAEVRAREFAHKSVPAAKILKASVFGGPRRQQRSEVLLSAIIGEKVYLIPELIPKNAYGHVQGAQFTRMLSALSAFRGANAYKNIGERKRASLGKRKLLLGRGVQGPNGGGTPFGDRWVAGTNFVIGRTRRGKKPWGIYEMIAPGFVVKRFHLTTKAPQYPVRYPFHQIAQAIIDRDKEAVTAAAVREVLRTAR